MAGDSNERFNLDRIKKIILKDIKGEISEVERSQLQEWIDFSPSHSSIYEHIKDDGHLIAEFFGYQEAISREESAKLKFDQRIVQLRKQELGEHKVVQSRFPRWPMIRTAAAAMLLLTVGAAISYRVIKRGSLAGLANATTNDLAPGGNKAVLTLSDGRQVVLDSIQTGTLADQGNAHLIKKGASTLAYTATDLHGKPAKEIAAYNTLSTPRSGTYVLELPDHSKVWLNNASSIRYPTSFEGQDSRTVELTGEAFFSVAPDAGRPFRVKVGENFIDVLGTSFNVQAYTNEPAIEATLISGSVKVIAGGQSTVLAPGEQEAISNVVGSPVIKLSRPENLRRVTAWKDGYFVFDGDDLQSVMRKLARWYDVDIVYEGTIPHDLFTGNIRRDNKASDVLKVLELTDVHFKIDADGKKITVTP